MAVTVRGTDILFNDGTTQSTAAGAVTTTAVLNATAGAASKAVGTYGWHQVQYTLGSTVSGSSLGFGSGTWRCMTFSGAYVPYNYTNHYVQGSLLLRIS